MKPGASIEEKHHGKSPRLFRRTRKTENGNWLGETQANYFK